jgi:hypothetical protein
MHWHHHANPGTPADPAVASNAAAANEAAQESAAGGGWVRHAFARALNFAAPRSEDFLPVVLDHEKILRAAYDKRHPGASEAETKRPH